MKKDVPLVSVVMPCLNEEAALGICIKKVREVFSKADIDGEIVVCDNASTDNSVAIAKEMGVRLVHEPLRGYGNAYLKGFDNARGRYLIMVDADDTYDFSLIPDFLNKLIEEGFDFVTGSRSSKGFMNRSMPFLHRYIGNPFFTFILNYFLNTSYADVYCGYRAFSRTTYDRIKPISPGMEFNLELAINAVQRGLKIAEIPIQLNPRKGKSKLHTMRDGWKGLRVLLLYCPNRVFLWPGFILLLFGVLFHLALLAGLVRYEGRQFGNVGGLLATIFSIVGFYILNLGLYSKTYSWSRQFDKKNPLLAKLYEYFKLETGLILGAGMVLGSASILTYLVIKGLKSNLSFLPHPEWAFFALTFFIIGINVVFTSLFISTMSMKKR